MGIHRNAWASALLAAALLSPALAAADRTQDIVRDLLDHVRGAAGKDTNESDHWNDRSESSWAAHCLLAIGKPAVPSLLASLGDNDPWVQLWAIEVLGRLKAREAIPAVLKILQKSEGGALLFASAQALARLNAQEARPALMKLAHSSTCLEPLVELMHQSSRPIRFDRHWQRTQIDFAAVTLGNLGDRRALPYILRTLQDGDSSFHGSAALAIARLASDPKARNAVPLLERLARDEGEPVRSFAALALGRLNAREDVDLLRQLAGVQGTDGDEVRSGILWALCSLNDQASAEIVERSLTSDDYYGRPLLAVTFAILRGRESVPELLSMLGRQATGLHVGGGYGKVTGIIPPNRTYAVGILVHGAFGVKASVDALKAGTISEEQFNLVITSVDERVPTVQGYSWPGITHDTPQVMLRPALTLLEYPDGPGALAVLQMLAKIPVPEAREPMIRILGAGDPTSLTSFYAALGLARIGDARAARPLVALLRACDARSLTASRLAARITPEPSSGAGLDRGTWPIWPAIRASVLLALAATKQPEALRELVAALDDPNSEVRQAGARGLGTLHSPAARHALSRHVADPDIHVRWEVHVALCDRKERPREVSY